MNAAVLYCRVSSQEQVKNLSLATQRERCTEYCDRNGWKVAHVFVEEGESAKTADRTELARLLAYCREHRGRVQYVVVYAVSRLARNTHDHHMLRAVLAGCGVQLRSVTEPIEDSSSGRFVETLLAAVAQLDNDQRSERTVTGLKASLARGRWPFLAPLGYLNAKIGGQATLVHDAERAPLIRRAYELAAEGESKAGIHAMLQAAGFKARTPTLTMNVVSRILASPAYMGVLEVPAWGVRERGAFEPIVAEELWQRAQDALRRREHLAPVHARARPDFPLRHFMRCGVCDRPLTGGWSRGRLGKRYAYYNCPNRRCRVNVRREALERAFAERLEELRPSLDCLKAFRAVVQDTWEQQRGAVREEVATLRRRISDLERRQEQLVDAFVYRREIEKAIYDDQRARLLEERALADMALRDADTEAWDVEALLDHAEMLSQNARRIWEASNHEQRQRLQRFVFPEGATFTKAAGIRTHLTGLVFSEIQPFLVDGGGVARQRGPGSNLGRLQINDFLARVALVRDLRVAA